jgi:hypothetical protein
MFEQPTVRGMAEWVEGRMREVEVGRGMGKGAGKGKVEAELKGRERGRRLPLSYAQQRLWFMDQMNPGSDFYNANTGVRLIGRLEEEGLERGLKKLVERHEALRTRFEEEEGGELVQVIEEEGKVEVRKEDLRWIEGREEREAECRRRVEEEGKKGYELRRGPLMRVLLVRMGEEEHVLVLGMHHIVSDGWSMSVLVKELTALYEAERDAGVVGGGGKGTGERGKGKRVLEELPIQYGDYVLWQREWLSGEVLEKQLEYWRKQLAGMPERLNLPMDGERGMEGGEGGGGKETGGGKRYRGGHHRFWIEEEVAEGLRRMARKSQVSLYMVMLGVWQVLLYSYSGERDVVVGSPISGRNREELEGLIGFFVNTLVMRVDVGGDVKVEEMLGRVRGVTLGAYAHQELPFERVVAEMKPERRGEETPLFQVMFTWHNTPREEVEVEGMRVER